MQIKRAFDELDPLSQNLVAMIVSRCARHTPQRAHGAVREAAQSGAQRDVDEDGQCVGVGDGVDGGGGRLAAKWLVE